MVMGVRLMGEQEGAPRSSKAVRVIEWVGTHPFATGLMAVLGIIGFVFSIYTFVVDQADSKASSAQAEKMQGSIIDLSVATATRDQGLEASVNEASAGSASRDEAMKSSLDRIERHTLASLQDRVPVVIQLAYPEARQRLIENGWIPARTRWQDLEEAGAGTVAWALWNAGYREVEDCAGTGTAPCRFNYVDAAGNRLAVVTEGETMEEIDYDARSFVGKPTLEDLVVTRLWFNQEELR